MAAGGRGVLVLCWLLTLVVRNDVELAVPSRPIGCAARWCAMRAVVRLRGGSDFYSSGDVNEWHKQPTDLASNPYFPHCCASAATVTDVPCRCSCAAARSHTAM